MANHEIEITESKMNLLTKHPQEVRMSYVGHACFALSLTQKTFLMTLASLVHAFLPFLFVTYTSQRTKQLYERLKNRTIND